MKKKYFAPEVEDLEIDSFELLAGSGCQGEADTIGILACTTETLCEGDSFG